MLVFNEKFQSVNQIINGISQPVLFLWAMGFQGIKNIVYIPNDDRWRIETGAGIYIWVDDVELIES
jgi:hypothetical protein